MSENETGSITDYVTERGITVEIITDRGFQLDDDRWEHHAYVLRVHNGDRSMDVPWRQGTGVETSPVDTPDEILDALVSDASAVDGHSLVDFLLEFGYEDLRKGERVYEGCRQIASELAELLGGDDELEYVTGLERL